MISAEWSMFWTGLSVGLTFGVIPMAMFALHMNDRWFKRCEEINQNWHKLASDTNRKWYEHAQKLVDDDMGYS